MRAWLLVATVAGACIMTPAPAQSQSYPAKPIRIVVGVPPGGTVDALARASAPYLSPLLGQPVIVENRPGASNRIANQLVADAAPDGHTLLSLGSSQVLIDAASLATGEERSFDTLKQLALVTTMVTNPYGIIVRGDLPVKTLNDFISLARAKPQSLNYGSTGVGKVDHVAMEMLQQQTGMQLLHVPFKGAGDALAQLLPGRIDVLLNSVASVLPQIRSGKVRLLAIVGSERSAVLPDVPTVAEAVPLPGYRVDVLIAIGVPAKTPAAIVNRLNAEYKKVLADEAFVIKVLQPQGLGPFYKTPADTTATFRAELEKYAKLFKDLGLKISE